MGSPRRPLAEWTVNEYARLRRFGARRQRASGGTFLCWGLVSAGTGAGTDQWPAGQLGTEGGGRRHLPCRFVGWRATSLPRRWRVRHRGPASLQRLRRPGRATSPVASSIRDPTAGRWRGIHSGQLIRRYRNKPGTGLRRVVSLTSATNGVRRGRSATWRGVSWATASAACEARRV